MPINKNALKDSVIRNEEEAVERNEEERVTKEQRVREVNFTIRNQRDFYKDLNSRLQKGGLKTKETKKWEAIGKKTPEEISTMDDFDFEIWEERSRLANQLKTHRKGIEQEEKENKVADTVLSKRGSIRDKEDDMNAEEFAEYEKEMADLPVMKKVVFKD